MQKHNEIRKKIAGVLQQHPGVEYRFEPGGKHDRVVIAFNGRERFVTFSHTDTDYRGTMNKLSDVRRVVNDLKSM